MTQNAPPGSRRRFCPGPVLAYLERLCAPLATAGLMLLLALPGEPCGGMPGALAAQLPGAGETSGVDAWVTEFGIAGVSGEIHTAALFEDQVVVAGEFQEAGDFAAANVAAWDGAWLPFGEGFNGTVYALTVHDGELYAGGDFTEADGDPAAALARWDGERWRAVTQGLRAAGGTEGVVSVRALGSHRGKLVIGGRFSHAGGQQSHGLAQWDGETLTAFEEWPADSDAAQVRSLTSFLGGLAVGGIFQGQPSVGDEPFENLAWQAPDGLWSSLDGGISGEVDVLLAAGDSLLVGGLFERDVEAGTLPARNIASWDGESWGALGAGVWGDDPAVLALAAFDGYLAVGGRFDNAGDSWASRAARWDGESWGRLSSGVRGGGRINVLLPFGPSLFAGGEFRQITSHAAYSAAVYSSFWNPLGRNQGLDEPVHDIIPSSFGLVASGEFNWAGSKLAEHIAAWSGDSWESWDSGLNDVVFSTAEYEGAVYAGGLFRLYAGGSTRHMAAFDGISWFTPRGGVEAGVRALLAFDGELVAGGDFGRAGGRTALHVAAWDGVLWRSLGPGLNGRVRALAANETELFAGGEFTASGDSAVFRVARWDGAVWSALGAGFDGPVHALCWFEGVLYAGGDFTASDGRPLAHVARFVNGEWIGAGEGFDGPVRALTEHQGRLLAGGRFVRSGNRANVGIAAWNGLQWAPLAGGVGGASPIVRALASYEGDLYAGGDFTQLSVGSRASFHLARWSGAVPLEVWPGDTDDNGIVDVFDVLPLGRHWGATGPSREGSSDVSWSPQVGADWTVPGAAFADANGDGIVDADDLQPIVDHWDLRQNGWVGDVATGAGSLSSALRGLAEDLAAVSDGSAAIRRLQEAVVRLLDDLDPATNAGLENQELALSVFPRPAIGPTVQLHLRLSRPTERLQVEIFDVRGRRVARWQENHVAAGSRRFAWTRTSGGRGTIHGAGVYFVRARAGDEEARQRIVVLD